MQKVVKFGGSSLASAKQFKKVKSIILSDSSRHYVIPSAPGKRHNRDTKVTDMLYACYAQAAAGDDFSQTLKEIRERYEKIIDGLSLAFSLDQEFQEIEKNFRNKEGKDYAASRGEYLNGRILAAYLDFAFVDAANVICFTEKGTLDAEKTNASLASVLAEYPYAVIPGFYGSMPDGSIHTFSRGGSDITGSLVARAILYENWTDVSGFLIADPRIIENPEVIDTITYRELRELSYMGATVLHEEAIFPVRKEGIPINIRNTNAPEDKGTMIVQDTIKVPKYTITGIAGKENFVSLHVEKAMMNEEIGYGRRVLQVLEDNGISFEHMPSGIDTLSVCVRQEAFEQHEQEVIAGIHRAVSPDLIELEAGIALIAVVGRGMKEIRGTAGRIFSALAHANVNVKMIDQGSSELNMIIGVKNEEFHRAVKAIYDIFVTTQL